MRQAATLEMRKDSTYSLGEEIAHGVTHGVGIVLSIVGLTVLVAFASLHGSALDVVASSIFGACLVLLYTASTLYHSIPIPRVKRILRVLDHSGIFLLIAGTYTPFALTALPLATGWVLFGVLWALAITGIVLTAALGRRFRPVALGLYVVMGWSALFVAQPLGRALGTGGTALLFAGGLAYTVGIAFYAMRRVPYHHLVWHLFVLAGSILHFFAVLIYVLPS